MIGIVFYVSVLVGCMPPITTVSTVDSRPSIAITGAPQGATLYVDGLQIGDANAYDGSPTVLRLEPGTHVVEIHTQAGAVVYSEKVFVESEHKTITVH